MNISGIAEILRKTDLTRFLIPSFHSFAVYTKLMD